MKLLVMFPHGNTAAFLEKQRFALSEKTGDKIFAFSPLYCPLAFVPEKNFTAAQAKKLLTGLRDVITESTKNKTFAIDGTLQGKYGNVTAFFCTMTLPFLEVFYSWCQKEGFQPIKAKAHGFCVGFSYGTKAADGGFQEEIALPEPHNMTVFQLGLIDFAPEAPFLRDAAEPLSFKWKLINSVWKAKQKEA